MQLSRVMTGARSTAERPAHPIDRSGMPLVVAPREYNYPNTKLCSIVYTIGHNSPNHLLPGCSLKRRTCALREVVLLKILIFPRVDRGRVACVCVCECVCVCASRKLFPTEHVVAAAVC